MGESHQVDKDGKTSYITRIKLVADAVLKQIEEMKKTHPNRYATCLKLTLISLEKLVL